MSNYFRGEHINAGIVTGLFASNRYDSSLSRLDYDQRLKTPISDCWDKNMFSNFPFVGDVNECLSKAVEFMVFKVYEATVNVISRIITIFF